MTTRAVNKSTSVLDWIPLVGTLGLSCAAIYRVVKGTQTQTQTQTTGGVGGDSGSAHRLTVNVTQPKHSLHISESKLDLKRTRAQQHRYTSYSQEFKSKNISKNDSKIPASAFVISQTFTNQHASALGLYLARIHSICDRRQMCHGISALDAIGECFVEQMEWASHFVNESMTLADARDLHTGFFNRMADAAPYIERRQHRFEAFSAATSTAAMSTTAATTTPSMITDTSCISELLHLGLFEIDQSQADSIQMCESGKPNAADSADDRHPLFGVHDTMSDVACLLVDFHVYGLYEQAAIFLSAYLKASGDYDGMRVLPIYACLCAMYRANLAAFLSVDTEFCHTVPNETAEECQDEAELQYRLAAWYGGKEAGVGNVLSVFAEESLDDTSQQKHCVDSVMQALQSTHLPITIDCTSFGTFKYGRAVEYGMTPSIAAVIIAKSGFDVALNQQFQLRHNEVSRLRGDASIHLLKTLDDIKKPYVLRTADIMAVECVRFACLPENYTPDSEHDENKSAVERLATLPLDDSGKINLEHLHAFTASCENSYNHVVRVPDIYDELDIRTRVLDAIKEYLGNADQAVPPPIVQQRLCSTVGSMDTRFSVLATSLPTLPTSLTCIKTIQTRGQLSTEAHANLQDMLGSMIAQQMSVWKRKACTSLHLSKSQCLDLEKLAFIHTTAYTQILYSDSDSDSDSDHDI
jgi:hypothetical protein